MIQESRIRRALQAAPWMLALGSTGCTVGSLPELDVIDSTEQALVTGDAAFITTQNATGSFDVTSSRSFNSKGATNHVTQTGTGTYHVDLPLLGSVTGGNVQVSAFGETTDRCRVAGWEKSGTTVQATVNCFNLQGAPTNTLFSMVYQRRSGNIGPESAYAWANQASSSSYSPSATYAWNSAGGDIRIIRDGLGLYKATFFGQLGATFTHVALVTPYGFRSNVMCQPMETPESNIETRVACFDGNFLVDSQFTIAYSMKSVTNIASYTYALVDVLFEPGTVNTSYGSIAGTCGVDQTITTPVTITALTPGKTRVHFPRLTVGLFSKSNVMVNPLSSLGAQCKISNWGAETGGAFADVYCFDWQGAPASRYQFMIVMSTTNVVTC